MQTKANLSEEEVYNEIKNAKKMTPEKLRTFSGFENIKEDEANHVIETLESFCGAIVRHIIKTRHL